jgi:transcriptional regulator with XRE-family HTH domain
MMNIITMIRQQRRWSQNQLARRAGLHPSTVSLLESGRLRLSPNQARKLARALKVPAEMLSDNETS